VVSVPEDERRDLAEALQWDGEPPPGAERLPARFLRRFRLYRVVHALPNHPVGLHAAWAPGEAAYVLTGEPQNFVAAALADGVSIGDAETAVDFGVAYLETTRRPEELLYVVASAAEVRLYPVLDPAEQERADAFGARYGDLISAPAARAVKDGWLVVLFAMRQQTLERLSLRLTSFGAVELSGEVLERDLPAVFAG
jgi:hypothetical protein